MTPAHEILSPVQLFELILSLLALVLPLELVARRLHLPPAAALIVAGMGLALIPVPFEVQLDPDLMLVLFLPPLLVSGGFTTVWRDFRANLRVITALAVGCVAFTTFVVGAVAHLVMPSLPWAACFTLGAIVSPPDALAAKAVLQRVTLPPRLLVLLEGESLVNDASGLVLYRFAVAAALTGTFSFGDALMSFGVLAIGGSALGIVAGLLSTWLLRRLHDAPLVAVGSLLTSWAAYIVADEVGVSGVLSAVACGLVMGWLQHEAMSAAVRTGATAVWESVEFVLESIVFVLIGLSLRSVLNDLDGGVTDLLPSMAAVTGAVILSRFVWIFGSIYGSKLLLSSPLPPMIGIPIVMSWAGMRGVVSLAIALSLPPAMPGRDFILIATFMVILVTVLLQGSTLGPLIALLKLGQIKAGPSGLLNEAETRTRLAEAQLAVVRTLAHGKDGELRHPRLLEQYEYRLAVMQRVVATEGGMPGARQEHFDLVMAAVTAGRAELLRLHRAGQIHDRTLRDLEAELDLDELSAIRRRGGRER